MAQQADKEVIMDNRTSKNVKCPFYHKHDYSRIKCEGLPNNSTIHLVFETQADKAKWMRERCNSIQACQKCLIHKALSDKWGMDDE